MRLTERIDSEYSSVLFSGKCEDIGGLASIYGRSNLNGTFWFIKLYNSSGRFCTGFHHSAKGVIVGKCFTGKSAWGSSFKYVKVKGPNSVEERELRKEFKELKKSCGRR